MYRIRDLTDPIRVYTKKNNELDVQLLGTCG
jgi:hypothetical protein